MSICIIDYHMGNLRSVKKAFNRIGQAVEISSDIAILKQCDKLVLPGVGHFERGIQNLKQLGLFEEIRHEVLVRKKPILGICLGMQLLTNHSEEGHSEGLGLIAAKTLRFPVFEKTSRFRVPHIGWNTVKFHHDNILFKGLEANDPFYFVHSYYIQPFENGALQEETFYGIPFISAVAAGHIFGTQFHPEKSYDAGLALLKNFCEL